MARMVQTLIPQRLAAEQRTNGGEEHFHTRYPEKLCRGEDSRKERDKFRAEFQKEAAKGNLLFFLDNWHKRVAHKLIGWKLLGNRHHRADRAMLNLQKMGKLVAPRVAAATWGLVWNRWSIARRFQSLHPVF